MDTGENVTGELGEGQLEPAMNLADLLCPVILLTVEAHSAPKNFPPGFVARQEEFRQAKARLLQVSGHRSIALSTALTGAGGYGKTTLAQALCADEEIRKAFAGLKLSYFAFSNAEIAGMTDRARES